MHVKLPIGEGPKLWSEPLSTSFLCVCEHGRLWQDSTYGQLLPEPLHRLEKCLNIQDCLEKSLKIKFALKST